VAGVAAVLAAGCSPPGPQLRAARLDERYGTGAFTWLVEHEPSRLDVARLPIADIVLLDPDARVRAVGRDLRAACLTAKADRALLLAFVDAGDVRGRAQALDCGFTLSRDAGALVLAPR